MTEKRINIDLLTDKPISAIEEDRFERSNFVEAIAEMIYSQSSQVNPEKKVEYKNKDENMTIGLFGSWGFGKSSVINLLTAELVSKGLQTIYFNPWIYRNEDQLIASLFDSILKKSGLKGNSKNKLKKNLDTYHALLKAIPIVGEGVSDVAQKVVGAQDDIYTVKERIDNILAGTSNPITVFIDDVDRLSKDEIHILFKTIRLIASFRHVIYVIACDFDMVAKSIKENYADGSIEDGRSFIDKIIQIPIQIPEISPDALYDYAIFYVKETCNVSFTKDSLFSQLLKYYFYTPRDVKRFINSLKFTRNYLKEIIDPIDLVFLEMIRVKIPDLYGIIRVYYLALKSVDPDTEYNQSIIGYLKKNKPEFIDAHGNLKGGPEVNLYNEVLVLLFNTNLRSLSYKYLNRHLSYKEYSQLNEVKIRKNLQNPQVLINYFERIEPLKMKG